MEVSFFVLASFMTLSSAQLTVNVKNKGGDLIQESIQADVAQDLIHLQFQKPDGTLISLLIDFKSEVQIFKALVLGEEERGQSQYQVMCFITKFTKSEFISSDAMSKLRQKNPGTIRNPEEDKGQEHIFMDLQIDLKESSKFSKHIYNTCMEAQDSTYIRESDIRALSKGNNYTYNSLLSATKPLTIQKMPHCHDMTNAWKPCTCQFEICLGWYPCGLKYCKGRDSVGKVVSFRCGIKTCRKCRTFDFFVKQKQLCLWDEP
ncbi:out at first protein-like isoform X1 [Saccoglossus kowalevskii]|uniref:Out at first protein-like isoform X1 n=1 Tax=Saccoglossus kowalevskii TaxID=10224 RepID=A0ABM0GWH9_SACKO|nr:PREDICTED: out at first protein-like isoform X1 [Saccoglossus kowalevskii]